MRKKTSFMVDEQLYKRLLAFVSRKHGSIRKVSVEIENAIREYLAKHEKEV